MNITDYILKDIKTYKTDDSVAFAIENTQKQLFTHIVVTNNQKYVSSLPITDINMIDEETKTINEFSYLSEFFSAKIDDTLFDLFNLFARNETNILPVTDLDHNYLGYYDLNDILSFFSDSPFFNEEGIVLIIEKKTEKFSFSEITQIIETNNAKLFGLFVNAVSETTTQITVKARIENANELIQSFRRYDYAIISNHDDDDYLEELKNRSQYLQKYLNI
jgi:Mg/Co/Ni transporter MgtE